MTLDTARFAAIVETAKQKAAGNRRWIAAIEKASAGVVSGWWVITELADYVAVTTETGKTYFANGVCQCEAFKNGQACKHRALYRLLTLYHEAETARPAVSRASLIADIKRAWPKTWPPLATELMARFRKNKLEMLDDDLLRRVRLAIAM